MKNLSDHLREFLATTRAGWRLYIVRCSHCVETVAPDIRAKLGESETGIVRDDALAEIGARLALAHRAVAEIVDLRANSVSEYLALRRLRDQEEGSQVHVYAGFGCSYPPIIDHLGLFMQTFLHVYQNGSKLYAGAL